MITLYLYQMQCIHIHVQCCTWIHLYVCVCTCTDFYLCRYTHHIYILSVCMCECGTCLCSSAVMVGAIHMYTPLYASFHHCPILIFPCLSYIYILYLFVYLWCVLYPEFTNCLFVYCRRLNGLITDKLTPTILYVCNGA